MFEARFRIVVQVETDAQGQRTFPVTKQLAPVNETEFVSLLASVYQEEVYPTLRTNDTLTVTAHLDAPTREVERTFRFREDRLFEGEGIRQPLQTCCRSYKGSMNRLFNRPSRVMSSRSPFTWSSPEIFTLLLSLLFTCFA